MTKRWSSTASMDGQTKRGASKTERAKADRELIADWVECDMCGAWVLFGDCCAECDEPTDH